jgi:hypothetical protein
MGMDTNTTPTCETFNIATGKCGQPATTRLTQQAAGMVALACSEHAASWLRTKKVRGQIVRVNPYIVAEAL